MDLPSPHLCLVWEARQKASSKGGTPAGSGQEARKGTGGWMLSGLEDGFSLSP